MSHCGRILRTIGLVATILMGAYPSTDIALSATAPGVFDLPAITKEIDTPVRLAKDSSGNLYVTNPSSGGILKYNSSGALVLKIITPKSGTGIAIAQNGDLLVTQIDKVAVIDPVGGGVKSTFGNFTYANGITVDPSGNIYVSDGKALSGHIKKYSPAYALLLTSSGTGVTLQRPAGLAYETQSNQLAIANSLAGTIVFVNPNNLSFTTGNFKVVGAFGYDATHAALRFTYPQGIAFEYSGSTLDRIYVADGYQSTIQVLDGQYVLSTATPVTIGTPAGAWLPDIGSYGFIKGKISAPSDVLFDQTDPGNKRVFVANGGGNLTIFGIDNMQPTYIQVINPTLSSLEVAWVEPTTPNLSKMRVYSANASGQPVSLLAEVTPGTTSFVNNGLSQGTVYYYLVRAVDTSNNEITNTQPVSGKTRLNYNLLLATVGAGTVNGTVSLGENSSNTFPILDNTLVSLTANPNTLTSVFDGWTGDCASAGINETCLVTMDAAKSVTANFSAQWPFLVDDWLYMTLHDAYQSTEPSINVIQAMTGTWPAKDFTDFTATADRPITVTIKGGYDSEFTGQLAGKTTVITGRFNVKSGKVIMNNVKIKP